MGNTYIWKICNLSSVRKLITNKCEGCPLLANLEWPKWPLCRLTTEESFISCGITWATLWERNGHFWFGRSKWANLLQMRLKMLNMLSSVPTEFAWSPPVPPQPPWALLASAHGPQCTSRSTSLLVTDSLGFFGITCCRIGPTDRCVNLLH